MLRAFLRDLYLFLPAFIGNALPVFAKYFPQIRHWREPVHELTFGRNKTWRGLAAGVAGGALTALVQFALRALWGIGQGAPLASSLSMMVFVGALLGIESAVKRAMRIPPGGALPFWDGADYIIGAMLVLAPFYVPPFSSIVGLLIAAPLLSLFTNMLAFRLGWKDRWY